MQKVCEARLSLCHNLQAKGGKFLGHPIVLSLTLLQGTLYAALLFGLR